MPAKAITRIDPSTDGDRITVERARSATQRDNVLLAHSGPHLPLDQQSGGGQCGLGHCADKRTGAVAQSVSAPLARRVAEQIGKATTHFSYNRPVSRTDCRPTKTASIPPRSRSQSER